MSLWKMDEYLSPQPAGDTFPTLEQLREYLGGWVQEVPTVCGDQPALLFIDEEGKIKGRGPNIAATAVLHARVQKHFGLRSYTNYATDNPFECLPAEFNDLVAGKAMVWVGPLPPEELE